MTPFPPILDRLRDRRVLVVEDDATIALVLGDYLEELGAVVLGPAPSVARALELCGARPGPEAATLDVNLRGEVVFPVADALASEGVPFVFMTGYEAPAIPDRFAHVPQLRKPVDFELVARSLAAAMGEPTRDHLRYPTRP